jgi:hypothetical protein
VSCAGRRVHVVIARSLSEHECWAKTVSWHLLFSTHVERLAVVSSSSCFSNALEYQAVISWALHAIHLLRKADVGLLTNTV